MYIIHLKPDQPEALSVRIDEWGVGPQNGHQALYSHPTNNFVLSKVILKPITLPIQAKNSTATVEVATGSMCS